MLEVKWHLVVIFLRFLGRLLTLALNVIVKHLDLLADSSLLSVVA